MRLRLPASIVVLTALTAAGAHARQGAPPQSAPPIVDLTGVWNRLDTIGGHSYGGISSAFPKAQLHPEFAAKLPPPPPPDAPPPAYNIREQFDPAPRCAVGGGLGPGNTSPTINSAGMSLVATKDLVLMLRDGAHGGRYMFADGRPFPARFNGLYTIGRWEQDAFVATTRGFTPGMTGFGDGWTEPTTELVETFRLSPDKNRLVITYQWNDPKVYVKPLVYEIHFERLPANQQIWESWCDSRLWIEANQKGTLRQRPEAP
jgi:hypothetical protein